MNNIQKTDQFDIVIVGGGPIGLSTAYHLAQSDPSKRILLVERYHFINDEVSSSGKSRQFRVQYDTKHMAELALRAEQQWLDYNKVSGKTLLDQVGALWFGDPETSSEEGGINTSMKVMDELGIPYEKFDNGTAIMDRFKFNNIQEDYSGFFQESGGILDIAATQEFLLASLKACNQVTLLDHTTVTSINSLADGSIDIGVKPTGTDGENKYYSTEKLALVPGPYINDLLSNFGLKVGVDIWEMSSAYYKINDAAAAEKSTTWYVFQEPQDTSLFYGFPEVNWSNPGYVRVAPAIPDRIISDPSERTNIPSEKSLGYNTAWVKDHMPGLTPEALLTSTCLITLSKDASKELLLDYLPSTVHNNKNIVVYTAGWAGKFIPTLGDLISKMLLNTLSKEDEYFVSKFNIDWQFDFDAYAPHVHKKAKTVLKSQLFDTPPIAEFKPKGHQHFVSDPENGLDLDVAIIGAGASGLYSGYRLKTGVDEQGDPLNKKVQIFEASHRICGRLDSIQLPGMNVTGELGGMRYMDHQELIAGLIDKFEEEGLLESIDFDMGDSEKQLYYLRKQRFLANEINESFRTHYYVEPKFQGKSANTIFNEIIGDVLHAGGEDLDKIQSSADPQAEWRRVKRTLKYNYPGSPYNGKFVYEIGFWNLLKDRSSQECFTFLADGGGYYSNTINWNAAEAFPYMVGDFADDDVEYKTLDGGFDRILKVIAQKFLQHGGTIRPNNALVTFEKATEKESSRKYKLIFQHVTTGEEHNFKGRDESKQWVVYADEIILGMPRKSLELLDQNNFFFDPYSNNGKALQSNIKTVISEPSLKILLGFEYPWWAQNQEDPAEHKAHSITDLPMRQCYYFGTDPENHHSLFLASYNDMRTVSFWKALENDAPFETKDTDLIQSDYRKQKQLSEFKEKDIPAATVSMVNEVMNQVREMHGPTVNVPEPYTSAYKDWSQDPYGGGYHAWKAGFVVADKMPEIRQPQPEERIFIVGEAYSDQQGWVEGAFCETEKVMMHRYGLKRPDWISKNYFLGWESEIATQPIHKKAIL